MTSNTPQGDSTPDTAEAKIRAILFAFAKKYHKYINVHTDEVPLSGPFVQQLKGLLVDARKQAASDIFTLAHNYAVNDKTMVGSEELRAYHYYNAIAKVGEFDER